MKISATINVNLRKLKRFKDKIAAQLAGGRGPIQDAFKQWAVRYRSEMQERFDTYSKGGGDWPALAVSTIKARRKGQNPKNKAKTTRSSLARDTANGGKLVAAPGGAVVSILRDIGLLYAALTPEFKSQPGAIEDTIPFGVKVGFGGSDVHGNGRATIADIASYHQVGTTKLPERKILVDPSSKVLKKMEDDMKRALGKLADDA